MAHWYNGTKSKMYVTFMWMEKISLQIFIVDKMSGLLYPGYISLCVLQIGFFVIGKCQLLQFPRILFIIQIFSCQARVQVQGLSQISNKRPGPGA